MSHQNRLHVFSALLILILFVSSIGSGMVSAAPTGLPALDPTGTPSLTETPSLTATPGVELGAEPEAWLDGSINRAQFGPMESLILHFNTPMALESNPHPIFSWPSVEGVSSWDDTNTVLTFTPSSALDSKKTYTFFLDPALHSTDGKTLKNAPEWTIHVQSGPKVKSFAPAAGSATWPTS